MSLGVLDLFSGLGGFSLAAERTGLRTVAFCEIEKFPRRVLAKHWPDTECHEDVRAVDPAGLRGVDLVTAGWPCQGHSVAGKRLGSADPRSGLFSEILRLVDGMAPRPRWLLLENVSGLVSSGDGRDFPAVVHELRRRGYVGCVRCLDAQHFGVAQRRRRLFFVLGLGAAGVRAVQLVLEGGGRYPAPRRATGEGASRCVRSGIGRSGEPERGDLDLVSTLQASGAGTARPGGQEAEPGFYVTAPALRAQSNDPHRSDMAAYVMQAFGSYDNDAFSADALKARDFKGATDLVTHTLRSDGFDASEDGTGRGTPIVAFNSQSYAQDYSEGRAPTRASEHVTSTFHGTQVRRLTPTECERLQGYPDGWTCLCGKNDGRSVGADPCTCADGPRYRALGNSIAVPCVEWLLRKIIEAEG